MKFKYLKQPSLLDPQKPWISRPFIPVRLVYKDKHIDVYGLVDSGADASLLHSSVAKELGIDLESGERKQFFGITEQGIDVYFHKIRLQIRGFSDSIELEVGFTNSK